MEWISVKDRLPNWESEDMFWVTDGETVGWCFYGRDYEDDPESENWMGGDLCGRMYEKGVVTHWIEIKLPNGKKQDPEKKIEANTCS